MCTNDNRWRLNFGSVFFAPVCGRDDFFLNPDLLTSIISLLQVVKFFVKNKTPPVHFNL